MKIKKGTYFIVLAFIPVAFFAALLSVNRYTILGMVGAIDCDGPFSVMLFSIPAYIVFGTGLVIFAKASLKNRNIKNILMLLVCVGVIALMTPNTINAIKGHNVNITQNKARCGNGW